MKVKISLTIDQGVLDRVDEAAWGSRRSRSAYVEDVLDGAAPHLPGGVLAGRGAGEAVEARRGTAVQAPDPRPASSSQQVTPDWRGGKP